MARYKKTIKYLCLAATVMVGVGSSAAHVHAAVEFMTSWQAKTYTPEWYGGRAFPTYQSFITVGFELIENGKIADLSKTAVRWYVDDAMLKNEGNGLGIKKVAVYNQKYGGDVSSVKISIPSYKGGALEKTIDVPIKNSEVVIDIPFFGKRLPKGENLIFAWPFYFNTLSRDMIGLQWSAEGGASQLGRLGEAFRLNVEKDTPSGMKYTIKAVIGSLKRAEESAIQSEIMEIQ